MKKGWKQPAFYFSAAIILLAAVLFLKKEPPQREEAQREVSEEPSGIVISPTFTETVPHNPTTEQNKPVPVFSATDWNVVVQCVSGSDFKKYFAQGTLELTQWAQEDERVRQSVDQILLHYKNAGESLRLRVFPPSQGAKEEGKEPTQLFKVDTDGLPTPIDMPAQWKNMSDNSILSMIRKTYPVSQTIENGRMDIPDVMSLEYTLENQQITQFQMQWQNAGKMALVACDRVAKNEKCICK